MSFDNAHNALDKLSTAIHALNSIESIAKSTLGDQAKDAFEALHIVALIISAVRGGFDGRLTVDNVEDEIKSLTFGISEDDLAADQALRDKFDKP